MKYYFIVLFSLCWLLSCESCYAQQLDKITSFKLDYWRAFNGEIHMTILRPPSGEIALNTEVTSPSKDGISPPTKKNSVKIISDNDLAPLLKFINDEKNREAFLKMPEKEIMDGSALALTVQENEFSIVFHAQIPFGKDATKHEKGLAQMAKYLFQLADLKIPNKELY